MFARTEVSNNIVHIADSVDHERSWHILHTNQGPLLVGLWYRPPAYGEIASIDSLYNEWAQHSTEVVATIVLGDMNVHNQHWLEFSNGTTPEGRALCNVCSRIGLTEKVRKPTRGEYLLDLVLTDILSGVACKVLPKISDHNAVLATFALKVSRSLPIVREFWDFLHADWHGLCSSLKNINWASFFAGLGADAATTAFTDTLLHWSHEHIPTSTREVLKSSHPWLDANCRRAIADKIAAEGTAAYSKARQHCTSVIVRAHQKYIERTKKRIESLPSSSKKWWKLCDALLLKGGQTSSIPPLKKIASTSSTQSGTWVLDSQGKADLFAEVLSNKYVLCDPIVNEYSPIHDIEAKQSGFLPIRKRCVQKILQALSEDSGSGPDKIPTKVLKRCAVALALPIAILCRIILAEGVWPTLWRIHWLFPLHKKKSRSDPSNYRGIHLTSQLSKIVERVFSNYLLPYLTSVGAFGPNQFAYLRQRGYRDALAFTVSTWVWAIGHGRRVALYCSDVSGAFDRVRAERLMLKLRSAGVHDALLKVIWSWLQERTAHACVDGVFSKSFALRDMVFQGTVLGPMLWNTYYADAANAINAQSFTEAVFADDLNSFREYHRSASDERILEDIQKCQDALHRWGQANQVVFEPSKESFHILDRSQPFGEQFKLLSILFDTKLTMHDAVHSFCVEANWRLRTLLRTKRFYTTKKLVRLFKCHVLSYIEGATPAVYHAAPSILKELDEIQSNFLTQVGVSELTALELFNLAPLCMRRDIAMLALLHKVSLGVAPEPICSLFNMRAGTLDHLGFSSSFRTHCRQLSDPVAHFHAPIIKRSVFGLIRVYNRLPSHVLDAMNVSIFQRRLQKLAKDAARANSAQWQFMFHVS